MFPGAVWGKQFGGGGGFCFNALWELFKNPSVLLLLEAGYGHTSLALARASWNWSRSLRLGFCRKEVCFLFHSNSEEGNSRVGFREWLEQSGWDQAACPRVAEGRLWGRGRERLACGWVGTSQACGPSHIHVLLGKAHEKAGGGVPRAHSLPPIYLLYNGSQLCSCGSFFACWLPSP